MAEVQPDLIVTCQYGLGRSWTAERALKSVGTFAMRLEGGTRRIAHMSPDELRKNLPAHVPFYIIYDHHSIDPTERIDMEAAEKVLSQAQIHYKIIDQAELAIMLYNHDVSINDFLT
jgi:hypothetical protein